MENKTPLTDILIGGESVLITSALASRVLAECGYEGQRKVDDDRALLHAERMELGTFLENSQIAFGLYMGRLYLVNGQHRMRAVEVAGRAYRFRVEIYLCNKPSDIDAIYCRFDQPGSQRSLSQVSRSLGLHDELDGGLRPVTAALLLRAVPLLMVDLRHIQVAHRPRATRDLDSKKDFAQVWKSAAIVYQGCLDCGVAVRTSRFRNAGVFAVALATCRYQPARAVDFWGVAMKNDKLGVGDPRKALVDDFLARKRTNHEFELAGAAAVAWNAFVERRQLKILRPLDPIRLTGTPYDGAA